MAGTDLVFRQAPAGAQPVELVFGDDGGSVAPPNATLAIVGTLPLLGRSVPISAHRSSALAIAGMLPPLAGRAPLRLAAIVGLAAVLPPLGGTIGLSAASKVTVDVRGVLPPLQGSVLFGRVLRISGGGALPRLGGSLGLRYASNAARPTVARVSAAWQGAAAISGTSAHGWQDAVSKPASVSARWQGATPRVAGVSSAWTDTLRVPRSTGAVWEDAVATHRVLGAAWQDTLRLRAGASARWQDGVQAQAANVAIFQDMSRDRRPWLGTSWQDGVRALASLVETGQYADVVRAWWVVVAQTGMPPPIGRRVVATPPAVDPCYVPPHGDAVHLVFADSWASSTDLVFICDRHDSQPPSAPRYVIPLLEIYMQVHVIDAVLLPGLEPVALRSATLATDADGYGWTLSASGPEHLLDQLAKVAGVPRQVRITVDGIPFVFAVTGLSRTRKWGERAVAVEGYSVTGLLAEPWMPSQGWASTAARTAQQLVIGALDMTGVDLDWQLTDWIVPPAAWTHTGAPLSVAQRIAEAAGAIVDSDRALPLLRLLPRYPLMPWEWRDAAPDVELPLAAVVADSLQPVERPAWNAVYVGGTTAGGVLGQVKRAGTAGDILAAQVTDALITHADAARQRGRSVLGAAGTVALQPLTLPVLTGGALPGVLAKNQLVKVVEPGETWRGLVRGVSLNIDMPKVRQTVTLERHLP